MRWPIARNRGSTPAGSTASVQAAGAEVRLLPITRAQAELRGFASERKTAVLLQASAAIVGLLLPVIAAVVYLAVSMVYLIEPFREVDIHAPRAAPPEKA
jgi:hypothetical protein